MNRKGQKSLEMIIGLVILLVVASVVISMFLNIFQEPDIGQDTVELEQVKQDCSSKCDEWKSAKDVNSLSAAVDYCTSTYEHDFDGDGSTSGVAGSGFNSYCEDGVQCFNVQTCESGFQTLDQETCRQLMCEYYTDINNDPYNITKQGNVHDHISDLVRDNVGSCGLSDLEDEAGYQIANWFNQRDNEPDFYSGVQGNIVCEEEYGRFDENYDPNN